MKHSDNIQNELLELSPVVAGIPRLNVFSVPDGYFEASLDDILHTVSGKENAVQGTVPEGYFEGLAAHILGKIKEGTAINSTTVHLVPGLPGDIYTVPAGYFDGLAANVLSTLR